MKILMELTNDCIIDVKFVQDMVGDKPDFVDESKKMANGWNRVQGITVLSAEYGNDGYKTGKLTQVWLSKDDVLKLSDKIIGIESAKTIGPPLYDLPF